jgi:hypothetical protein
MQRLEPGKPLVPRPRRGERPREVETDHLDTHRARHLDAAIARVGVDVDDRRLAADRLQTAAEPRAFVSPNHHHAQVIHGSCRQEILFPEARDSCLPLLLMASEFRADDWSFKPPCSSETARQRTLRQLPPARAELRPDPSERQMGSFCAMTGPPRRRAACTVQVAPAVACTVQVVPSGQRCGTLCREGTSWDIERFS